MMLQEIHVRVTLTTCNGAECRHRYLSILDDLSEVCISMAIELKNESGSNAASMGNHPDLVQLLWISGL